MRVKTLRDHQNAYGDRYEKTVGDEYDHPAPQILIDDKIVEKAEPSLASMTKPQLLELAGRESVTVEDGATKAQIMEAVEAKCAEVSA